MKRTLSMALLVILASGGCGSGRGNQAGSGSGSPVFPLAIAASNGPVVIKSKPRRIVSLSPTATEMLFAIGAGAQVVAVDDQSNYPPQAPRTTLSGLEPNAEAIAGYDPDLVIFSNDIKGLSGALATLQVPAVLQPAANTLDDSYAEIDQLGLATGHSADAKSVVSKMKSDIRSIVGRMPHAAEPRTYYHELDSTLYSVTSSTFIGTVYALLGLRNIADAGDPKATGYPQLSPEFIIHADPDLIFLADTKCCRQSAAAAAKRPGWSSLSAVRNGHVIELDDDIASRWGPRIIDFLRGVADAVRGLDHAA